MKTPKYPCADGVNRDTLIKKRLELELERRILTRQFDELSRRRSRIISETSAIEFSLGGIGHVAYKSALDAIDAKAEA